MSDHPTWPTTTDAAGVEVINEDWDRFTDEYWRPGLRGAEFTLVADFDLSRVSHATEPWEYVAEMDWGEDDDEREATSDYYEFLADTLESDPGSVAPIVVVINSDGTCQVLDGCHRSGIALARGITEFPAYVVDGDRVPLRR